MDTSLLEYFMKKKGVSKKDLAECIDVKYNAICLRLSGKIEFKRSEISKIAKLLELSKEQVINIFFNL